MIVPSIPFRGRLEDAGRAIPVRFSAEVDLDGHLNLSFEDSEVSADAVRLVAPSGRTGDRLSYLTLSGEGPKGETISSTSFHVTSYTHGSGEGGHRLIIRGSCREAEIVLRQEEAASRPLLIWGFRRVRTIRGLQATLAEGQAWIGGAEPDGDHPQKITGALRILGPEGATNEDWWSRADGAADHVFRVMSLATGMYLKPYIRQRVVGDRNSIMISGHSEAPEPFLPPFHFLHLDDIFACACSADDLVRQRFKQLDAALQWFLSPAHYDEIRLLTAMTALENVVEEAFPSDRYPIVERGAFRRLERKIKDAISEMGLPEALKAKVQELNRPSLAEKLTRYLDERGIIVSDIPLSDRAAVIKARNGVVHRGVYPHDLEGEVDIWRHIMVAREVLIRVFLQALSFEGIYFSNLFHDRQLRFPSCRRVADDNRVEIAPDDPAGDPTPN